MPTPAQEPDFAAFIAIDWADREHVWALQLPGSTKREKGKLKHTPEAIEAWAMQWASRFEGRPVAVALEQSRGALVYALSKYPHLVLYPIHPKTSHDYRKAMVPSGAKDDPRDAGALLDLLTVHRDRLQVLQPDDETTRMLQALVEKRRQLVDERTAQTNRITQQLKLYFPQVLDWFEELSAPIVASFLQRWPTLPALQKEAPETVRSFFHQHGSRSTSRIERRLHEIPLAKPLLEDAAVIEPGVLVVRILLTLVADLNVGIRELQKKIEQISQSHPDYSIFSSFPAAGPTMAPRLLAAFGSRRDRYRTASELQSFCGIAPVTQASGRQRWIHFRWACPKFLRQTFHEYAGLSIQHCAWAKAFYRAHKTGGRTHHAAVRALAYKWIRILFRCWQSRQPYQEALYLDSCHAKAAPPLSQPQSPPPSSTLRSARCGNPSEFSMRKAGDILKSLMAGA